MLTWPSPPNVFFAHWKNVYMYVQNVAKQNNSILKDLLLMKTDDYRFETYVNTDYRFETYVNTDG
jgi:hypothetical protein